MTAKRLTITIGGTTLYCCACESAEELEALLASPGASIRSGVNLSSAPGMEGLNWPPRIEPERSRGRPSFAAALAEAVTALQLDPAQSISDRARQVLKYLAETQADADLPATRTVRDYLARSPVGRNVGEKPGRKSRRARIARTGG